jgi:hypothetical protein
MATASIPDGTVVPYVIEDTGNAWETGYGTVGSSATTLTRNVRESSNANALLNLSGTAVVKIGWLAQEAYQPFAIVSSNYTQTTIADTANHDLKLTTEVFDADGIVTLASDVATFTPDGWYEVELVVNMEINGGSAVSGDGYVNVFFSNTGPFDNTFVCYSLAAGTIIDFNDFCMTCSVELHAALGANQITVNVENQSGHSLDAYVHELRLKLVRAL